MIFFGFSSFPIFESQIIGTFWGPLGLDFKPPPGLTKAIYHRIIAGESFKVSDPTTGPPLQCNVPSLLWKDETKAGDHFFAEPMLWKESISCGSMDNHINFDIYNLHQYDDSSFKLRLFFPGTNEHTNTGNIRETPWTASGHQVLPTKLEFRNPALSMR